MTSIQVRQASIDDLPYLESIERRAASRFDVHTVSAALATKTVPFSQLQEGQATGMLWVAAMETPEPVGFLIAEKLDDDFHVSEMSVIPSQGRLGIGTALLRAAVQHAWDAGYERVSLTTFATPGWNAPFYARQGFRRVTGPEMGPALAARVEQERELGLTDRVAMCRSRPA